ncbi:MAG: hypothetical protein BA866_02185 [Desulfobulbaceae bacterium S5133MH15]|nr:MAG: hypothetical protein BA866_02185 [Desulfobulbaceae bacterium S5133MH15]
MDFNEKEIREAFGKSWSSKTAIQWQPDNPALGQCNVTALLVDELFGGRILKTKLQEGLHFYNEINGIRYDFTDSQFKSQIKILGASPLANARLPFHSSEVFLQRVSNINAPRGGVLNPRKRQ